MTQITSEAQVAVNVVLRLTEIEVRALNALATYSTDKFLEIFYEKLGKSYLQPYEKGVYSLFETIRKELPQHLQKADIAKELFEPQKKGRGLLGKCASCIIQKVEQKPSPGRKNS